MDFTYEQTMEWASSPESENPFTSDYRVLYFTLFIIIVIAAMWYFLVWTRNTEETKKSIIDEMNKNKHTIDAYDESGSGSGSDSSAESDDDNSPSRQKSTSIRSPRKIRVQPPKARKSAVIVEDGESDKR